MNAPLIKAAEDLLLSLKDQKDLPDEIKIAYYNLVQVLIEIRAKEISKAIEDLQFQTFLQTIGIQKK
jgi:hypothetical protein